MSTIIAETRSTQAKAKQLRRQGITPCSIFGASLPESRSIQMNEITAQKLLKSKSIGSKIQLELNGEKLPVLIKDVSKNTVKNEIEHIGFQLLEADKKINSIVHIVLINRDKIAGFVNQTLFEIPYTAYPKDIMDTITIDLAKLIVGDSLTVKDLEIAKNDKIELLIDIDSSVLNITDLKRTAAKDSAEDAQ